MTALGPHTITRLRAGETTDRYGDTVTDWDTPDTVTIAGCSVQPAPGLESTDRRNAVVSAWNLWAPADADLLATDRVEWQNQTYEIDGEVGDWSDFGPGHKTAFLRKVSG